MSVSHRRPAPLVASAALILLAVGPAALASSPAA